MDATNPDAARELTRIRRLEEQARAKQRKAFGGIFKSDPGERMASVQESSWRCLLLCSYTVCCTHRRNYPCPLVIFCLEPLGC